MLSINFPESVQSDITSVDLWALTRQSWDLIVLAIRAFSALTYFKTAKAVKFIESGNEEIKEDQKDDLTNLSLEIDYIRRELYE